MLILIRKLMEKIIIGEGDQAITVMVTDIRDNAVRLGIDAPNHIRVDRSEVRAEKERAAGKPTST